MLRMTRQQRLQQPSQQPDRMRPDTHVPLTGTHAPAELKASTLADAVAGAAAALLLCMHVAACVSTQPCHPWFRAQHKQAARSTTATPSRRGCAQRTHSDTPSQQSTCLTKRVQNRQSSNTGIYRHTHISVLEYTHNKTGLWTPCCRQGSTRRSAAAGAASLLLLQGLLSCPTLHAVRAALSLHRGRSLPHPTARHPAHRGTSSLLHAVRAGSPPA